MSKVVDINGREVQSEKQDEAPKIPPERVKVENALRKFASSETGHADAVEFLEDVKEFLPYLMPQEAVILLYGIVTAIIGVQEQVMELEEAGADEDQ